MKSIDVEDED